MREMSLRIDIRTFLLSAVVMLLLVLLAPGKVEAGTPYVWHDSKTMGVVPLEYGPTDAGNPRLWMTEGTRFKMKCWKNHKGITGNYYSSKWFYGQEYSRGSWGWVHSSFVKNQSTVDRCTYE